MTALLHIGPDDNVLLDTLRASGVDVTTNPSAAFDVVVIAPDVDAPLQVARRLRTSAPDAHIVFLTKPETDPVLRRELRVARLGTHWSITPAEPAGAAADVVRQALDGTERRRKLRTTLARINMHLAQPAPPPPRRALISDHFLASVLDQLSDAVVVLDPTGDVLAYNGAAARAFGEIRRGAPFAETLPAAASDAIRIALRDGEADATLVPPQAKNDFAIRATALRDADGQVIGIALVARDVTAARKEERRRHLVTDAVRVLASTLDVRNAMQQLTTLLVADFAEIAVADILEGDEVTRYAVAARTPEQERHIERSRGFRISRNRDHPSMSAMMRGETVVRNDVDDALIRSVVSSEEHFRAVQPLHVRAFIATPLRAGAETVGALLAIRSDGEPFSSDDSETMQEIARQTTTALHNIWSYHAAAEASRLKDEFLATLSHELRTPMTAILGWAQILRLDEGNPELLHDGLDSIERSARVQAQLIDDLLDLSRMQMGKLQFQPRPFSVTTVVRAAIDTVRPAAQAKNVALVVDADQEAIIVGDPDRMQQVIWNLLSNAVKFSEAGSEVRVSVTCERKVARIAVADHGRGIAPEFLPHVFDRFRQADSATTRRFGGLGLGLAIVKQLVELHGGTVAAASPGVGRGATFTVTLPLATTRTAEPQETQPAEITDLSGLALLLVEDDAATAAMLATMLRRAGAEVRVAHSAAAALEAVREQLPDVLVSDVAMPDEDGLSLIRSIRGTLRIPAERLPAIALTAFSDVNLRVTLLGAGFQRFMNKPVDAETLASAVAACARRK